MSIQIPKPETFLLNGKQINFCRLLQGDYPPGDFTDYEKKTTDFIKAYLGNQEEFVFQTSGSTGSPKAIEFRKIQLQKSAERTNTFFGLLPGSSVLACLNTDFVAGKMMLVRALEGNLNLIIETPSSNPLSCLSENQIIDFMALTPNQLVSILNETPEKLDRVTTILLGGAGLNPNLEERLQVQKPRIFHSYAMTETLTHVALREVNGSNKSAFFQALPGASFSVDDRNCLIVNDHVLGIYQLTTNDIVELLDDESFRWIGRFDNIINSGGIKIPLEETENQIIEILQQIGIDFPLCLLSLPDAVLGEKLVLLIEAKEMEMELQKMLIMLKLRLPKYHAPKEIIIIPELLMTNSGKTDRIQNKEKYLENSK